MPLSGSNDDKDFRLLLSIIANQSNGGAVNWVAVAQECGYNNPQSCRNRMNALKKLRAPAASSSGTCATESPKTSPKKSAGVKKASGTGKRGRPKKVVEKDDNGDAPMEVKKEAV